MCIGVGCHCVFTNRFATCVLNAIHHLVKLSCTSLSRAITKFGNDPSRNHKLTVSKASRLRISTADSSRDRIRDAITRIEKADLTDKQFVLPANFDPEKFLSVTFGRFAHAGRQATVRLLFDRDAAYWVLERQWHPKQKVKRRRDGKVELSFPTLGFYEVRRWVLAWGHNVRVLAPTELQAMVRKEIRLMAASER